MKRASKLKRRRRANDRPQQQLLRPQSNLEPTPPTAAYKLASAISAAPTSSSIADAVTAPMDSTRTFFGDGNAAASTSINLHRASPDSGSPSAGSRSNHYDGNGRCGQGVGLGPYAARVFVANDHNQWETTGSGIYKRARLARNMPSKFGRLKTWSKGHFRPTRNAVHPILGTIYIPVAETEVNPDDKNSCNTGGSDRIEFRRSLGISEEQKSFPRLPPMKIKDSSWYDCLGGLYGRLGDGLRVPLSALALPTGRVEADILFTAKASAIHPISYKPSDAQQQSTQKTVAEENATINTTPTVNATNVRIISSRGATIREDFNIDESKYSLGRLRQDDVCTFVEKRWLAPPPFLGPVDDHEDDECVGVYRYRVILNEKDQPNSIPLPGPDGKPHQYGWISDRGRFATDCYKILQEE